MLKGPSTLIISPICGSNKAVEDFNSEAKAFDVWRQNVRNPYVREHRNVFVNRLGQVWRPDGKIIRDCGRQLPVASREAAAFARRIPVAGLAISAHAGNFYHWMVDLLPSLSWRTSEEAEGIPLVIGSDAAGFVRESLALIGCGSSCLEEVDDAVFVERLDEGEATGARIQPDGAHKPLLERLRMEADSAGIPGNKSAEWIYISRRDSPLRSMSNEEELEEAVTKIGFKVLRFSSHNLLEQSVAIRHARFVLGPHGAGFSHIIFSRPDTHFFEVTPYEAGSANQRYCMARMSRIMGNQHTIWLESVASASGSWAASIEPLIAKVSENIHRDSKESDVF